jgi:L-malate glycosyltransferase
MSNNAKRFMNILHVSYHKSWRGGEQQISYLIGELHKMDCNQWVYCSKDNALEQYCAENKFSYYSFSNKVTARFYNARELKYICRKHSIDLIHVHDAIAHQMIFAAGLLGNNVPIIVSRRVDFPVSKSYLSHKKYNYHKIKKIICVSNKILHTLEPDIEEKSKLTVIHDGIDLEKFSKNYDRRILHRQYGINEKTKIIGYISALSPLKDHYTFIDTAKKLIGKGIDAKFFIIGEGLIRGRLEKYAEQSGLKNDIIFTGFRNDIPSILPEIDVFLFTSVSEGLGTSILDALASRVPVVSTNAGGIPEIIEDGITGLVAGIKDSELLASQVEIILTDEELKSKLVNNASEKVKSFSKEIMANKTLSVYEEILK